MFTSFNLVIPLPRIQTYFMATIRQVGDISLRDIQYAVVVFIIMNTCGQKIITNIEHWLNYCR